MAKERSVTEEGREPDQGELIICRCEEVSRKEILEAIEEGATTVGEVKWRTRAGMGLCQGKTCRRLVTQILSKETDQPVSALTPFTHRPPVRPVRLDVLASLEDGEKQDVS
jgi:NAD(P)H-nitrite reductase large subunit